MTRLVPILRLALAVSLGAAVLGLGSAPSGAAAAPLPRWTGGVDLYRPGVFTTQKTWLWCTAADVQIMRNIDRHGSDHTRASQQRYFDYMRARNRYDIPVADGVDPAGWTAGLRRYVDSRYRLVASRSFDAALRSAVTNLRRSNLPVGITVSHGGHAWVLTGFTATADPAVTTRFRVTSVRVVGPLWGLQSRSYGYDMRPDTKLTPRQLRGFFTPWHYGPIRMAWEGRWVSVQPVTPAPAAAPKPTRTPAPTARPAAPTPAPSAAASPTPIPSPSPLPPATASPVALGLAGRPSPTPDAGTAATGPARSPAGTRPVEALAGLAVLGAAALGLLLLHGRRGRPA